jgi:hypothetical protein
MTATMCKFMYKPIMIQCNVRTTGESRAEGILAPAIFLRLKSTCFPRKHIKICDNTCNYRRETKSSAQGDENRRSSIIKVARSLLGSQQLYVVDNAWQRRFP